MTMSAGTLQQLVSTAASLHPNREAVTYHSGFDPANQTSLSYRELMQLSTELSGVLMERCPVCRGLIGLYCTEDVLTPVWILGVLQSAAAYVPLDPEAPGLLSARVINQCGLKYCVVRSDLLREFQSALTQHLSVHVCVELPKFKLTLVQVKPHSEPETGTAGGGDVSDTKKDSVPRELAYVLHTSGTTGVPKSVRVPHSCILPNVLHLRSLFQMREDDVVFLASPLTFDPSVVDIFLALSSGARLLIVPAVIKKMPNQLADILFRHQRTTVLQVTPTLLLRFGQRTLTDQVLSSTSTLRVLALGGEAFPSAALLRSWKHKDNQTSIFNIYGITEVSCWACCYKLPDSLLQDDTPSASSVPLGTPLMDTVIEVRGEDGVVVTEGQGQVFIGGEDRVCLLSDEDAVVPGTMRATGDWVEVKDSQLYYMGRRDRTIKRNGKRVNLDSLQQLVLTLPQVEACAVALHQRRLISFVVASDDQTVDGDLKKLLLRQLSLLLPSHSVPDTVVLVQALSLTSHGKVDTKALIRTFQQQRSSLGSSRGDATKLRPTLQTLWKDSLGLPSHEDVDYDSNFLLSGGDSLKALSLCEDIQTAVGVDPPRLLEVILNGSFSDLLHLLNGITQTPQLELSNQLLPKSQKRHSDAPPVGLQAKRERKRSSTAGTRAVRVIKRGGEVLDICNVSLKPQAHTVREKDSDLSLSLSWSSDTGRCVDASPVILIRDGTEPRSDCGTGSVFIGSHSHRIQALDLSTGIVLWERVLGDRIEASAAVSHCGSLVIVGCYDGCVYFLCAESGETRWTYQTGDAVKCSPAVDPLTGHVIVGSHDGHVYALNPQTRQCIWKCDCSSGAVFSSPHLLPSQRRVFVATLGGRLLCLSLDNGDILWAHCGDVPFFSSPTSTSGHILIGSVDGNISCFNSSGEVLWQRLTKGPVFSSPCVTADQQRLLCGSHDGLLYCLSCADGSDVWVFETTGKVYSTPCVFDGSAVGRSGDLVGVASTDGTVWILDGGDGHVLASHTLSGELFSSPVVWEDSLIVGCRNDFVYCLKLT
ncbi:beta-alanine-activating enzyme isoform X2 [Gouania willdenowi]|uniref:beta-alanine-activating enzyme isoform X2 n=1 Tax=Gouania willdenowi TaxID=441366 RepID=UPI001054919E|nr:beta-alanine-activating enzyme isoform X2 [Gouania willdenowi]